jgi:dCMP deaminase
MNIIVVAIIGDFCSGKKTIADLFVNKYGFHPLENTRTENSNKESQKQPRREIEFSLDKVTNINEHFSKLAIEDGLDLISESDKLSEFSTGKTEKFINSHKKETLKEKIKRTNKKKIVIYPSVSWEDYLEMRNKTSFRVINVISSAKKRYENFQKKYSGSSVENFFDQDRNHSSEVNFNKLKMQAFSHIENEGSLEDLDFKIEKLHMAFSAYFRPSWDDYFMAVAHILADRCNCIKQKVGALLVKNNRILSTGYNGTPGKIENCYKGGCTRCNDLSISQGKDLDTCFCLHAEENAV